MVDEISQYDNMARQRKIKVKKIRKKLEIWKK